MSSYLSICSNAPGAVPLVLADGTPPFTPWVLVAVHDLGNPRWTHQTSGPRGTQGRRVVSGTIEDRVQAWGLLSQDQADKDELADTLSALYVVVDDMRRFGGTIVSRELNQTRKQRWDVMVASFEVTKWESNEFQLRDGVRPLITATVAPYSMWDPYDFSDLFTADNVNGGEAHYIADAGALTNLAVTAGTLKGSANLGTENRLVFVGSGYQHGDVECELKLTPGATITSLKAGVILKRIDASNYIEAYIDDNGTNSRVRIDKVVATVRTNLATANLGARMSAGTRVGIRGRIEGNLVAAGFFGTYMTFDGIPTTAVSATLSTADAALFGGDQDGECGIVFTPQHASAYLTDYRLRPFTYRSFDQGPIRLRGTIHGDAPATCDLWATNPGGGLNYRFGMLGWSSHKPFNRVQLGGFESVATSTTLWSVAAVTGITGAATSIANDPNGRFGQNSGLVTTPATANVGATYALHQRFYAGITYTFDLWVRAASATHNVRLRLGVSGDVASETASALSGTWTKRTVSWTPTASVRRAYLCIEQTVATAGTFNIDGVCVYEGTVAPTHGRHAEGVGGFPPLAQIAGADYAGKSSNLAIASDSNAVSDFCLQDSSVLAAGETYQASYVIDPSLLGQDDYSDGKIGVEVWTILKLSAAFTGGVTAIASASPWSSSSYIYTAEHGSAGRTLTMPSSGNDRFGLFRLGRLNLGASDHVSWLLLLTFNVAIGTNLQAFGIDSVFLVPSRSVARTPTGKPDAGYPNFFPVPAAIASKRIRSADLSGNVLGFYAPDDLESGTGSGMHGKPIELPPGDVDAMFLLWGEVPDGVWNATAETAFNGSAVHFAVTPRSGYLRGT